MIFYKNITYLRTKFKNSNITLNITLTYNEKKKKLTNSLLHILDQKFCQIFYISLDIIIIEFFYLSDSKYIIIVRFKITSYKWTTYIFYVLLSNGKSGNYRNSLRKQRGVS